MLQFEYYHIVKNLEYTYILRVPLQETWKQSQQHPTVIVRDVSVLTS